MSPRMTLRDLLADVADPGADGDIMVTGLNLDSRAVQPGDAFVALQGGTTHGMAFAPKAVEQGAVAILAEKTTAATTPEPRVARPVIWIDNLRQHLGVIADKFYDAPSRALTLIGVTGTNGKTSTVQMLAQALDLLGHDAASIGTLGAGLHGHLEAGERTTPDVISVHRQLADLRTAGASHVAMEVSSHALDQHRVDDVDFDLAVF